MSTSYLQNHVLNFSSTFISKLSSDTLALFGVRTRPASENNLRHIYVCIARHFLACSTTNLGTSWNWSAGKTTHTQCEVPQWIISHGTQCDPQWISLEAVSTETAVNNFSMKKSLTLTQNRQRVDVSLLLKKKVTRWFFVTKMVNALILSKCWV